MSVQKSGAQWTSLCQGSTSTRSLSSSFGVNVERFIGALERAGTKVVISATRRPPERAYLMHYAWKIAHGEDPASVPAMSGVDIDWAHLDANGIADRAPAVIAAQSMVSSYGMSGLHVAPAISSRHTEGNAIDMTISWSGTLLLEDASGKTVSIASTPRDGMNNDLAEVGKSYGVIKFVGGAKDRPHWSNDGH